MSDYSKGPPCSTDRIASRDILLHVCCDTGFYFWKICTLLGRLILCKDKAFSFCAIAIILGKYALFALQGTYHTMPSKL